MDKIIAKLKAMKMDVAEGRSSTKLLDCLNDAIALCEKQREIYDAMAQPIPSQLDTLPELGTSIVIEQATINIYGNIPPGLE